nr:MAG TPA: baseplate assembly protein W [Caudoviricetes sp.]
MKASGNGDPAQCVGNLLRLIRGEVPYERLKGMDPRLIDQPSSNAAQELMAEAEWLIETYEPRVSLESIDLTAALAQAGHFNIKAETS